MTLTRLLLAWLPVAVVFAVVGRLGTRFFSEPPEPGAAPAQPGPGGVFTPWMLLWRSLEAGAVTLFASLWFDSLGHGEWWLLFGLVGLAVACAQVVGSATAIAGEALSGRQRRAALRLLTRDVARYLLAGAILAWRLG